MFKKKGADPENPYLKISLPLTIARCKRKLKHIPICIRNSHDSNSSIALKPRQQLTSYDELYQKKIPKIKKSTCKFQTVGSQTLGSHDPKMNKKKKWNKVRQGGDIFPLKEN